MSRVFTWLKCTIYGHDYEYVRAKEYVEGGYHRIKSDGTETPIPACTIVSECQRCGSTREIYASVNTAELFDLPKEWKQ